jgi:cell division protein FtsB
MPPRNATRLDTPPGEPILPSVLFWLCLFAAVTLFGAVFLAPKLIALHRLEVRRSELALRLDRLEQRNTFLVRVIDALENDPEFTAEVARFDLNAAAPDEEHLPVAPVRPGTASAQVARPAAAWTPWWLPLAELFAADRTLIDACLLTAGGLAVVAFTFFQPAVRPRRPTKQGGGRAGRRAQAAASE